MICRPIYFDVQGHVVAPQFYCSNQDGGQRVLNAISPWSNAGLNVARFTVLQPEDTLVRTGTYASIYDAAELVFASTTRGSRVRVLVPAPLASVFMGDTETVDPGTVAALITAILTDGRAPSGELLTEYVSGTRRRLSPAR